MYQKTIKKTKIQLLCLDLFRGAFLNLLTWTPEGRTRFVTCNLKRMSLEILSIARGRCSSTPHLIIVHRIHSKATPVNRPKASSCRKWGNTRANDHGSNLRRRLFLKGSGKRTTKMNPCTHSLLLATVRRIAPARGL